MASLLLNRPIPLKLILSGDSYAVKEIRPRYSYVNGNRTDTLEGFVYNVVNMQTLDMISVLVKQDTPVVTQEEILARQSKNEKVMVSFENAVIRQYMRRDAGTVEDSISADGVRVIAPGK